jgi:hypothetical protein
VQAPADLADFYEQQVDWSTCAPYTWSQALADQLESGHLLTWKSVGHTAYGRSNDCIRDAVDTYLLDGALPEEGTTS